MTYFVSRQRYWGISPEEGGCVVEVARGGKDYAGPDMLVPKYPGECEEYEDPREAIKAAIEVCRRWRADGQTWAQVAAGDTLFGSLPLEPIPEAEAMEWAEAEYSQLPKCDWCGDILPDVHYWNSELAGKYCSSSCAEDAYNDAYPPPECDWCGAVLPDVHYWNPELAGEKYCSLFCAREAYEDAYPPPEEEDA